MFSVVPVCHSVHKGGCHVTITHDALELTIQVALSPLLLTLVSIDCSNLFTYATPTADILLGFELQTY